MSHNSTENGTGMTHAEIAAFRDGQLAERARIAILLRTLAGGYESDRSDWEVGWRSGVMKAALMVEFP